MRVIEDLHELTEALTRLGDPSLLVEDRLARWLDITHGPGATYLRMTMSHTKAGRMMRTMDVPPAPTIGPGSERPELNHRTRAESLLFRLDTGGERPPEGMTWPAALTLATVAQAHATLALASQPPAPISAEAVHEQVVAWCAHLDPDVIERACLEAAEASGAKGASPFAVLPTVLEQAATRWWLDR